MASASKILHFFIHTRELTVFISFLLFALWMFVVPAFAFSLALSNLWPVFHGMSPSHAHAVSQARACSYSRTVRSCSIACCIQPKPFILPLHRPSPPKLCRHPIPIWCKQQKQKRASRRQHTRRVALHCPRPRYAPFRACHRCLCSKALSRYWLFSFFWVSSQKFRPTAPLQQISTHGLPPPPSLPPSSTSLRPLEHYSLQNGFFSCAKGMLHLHMSYTLLLCSTISGA